MAADGRGQTNLTNQPRGMDTEPNWSPDGSKIAFASTRDGNWEVYIMANPCGHQMVLKLRPTVTVTAILRFT